MTRRRPPLPGPGEPQSIRLTRRGFLGTAGASAAAAVVGAGCTSDDLDGGVSGPGSSSSSTPADRARQHFSPKEAELVEAITARILPGTPDDPGAREAEVVVYIDSLLGSGGWGNEPIYRNGPFVTADEIAAERAESEGEEDEEEADGGSPDHGTTSFGVTRRPVGAFDRYGEQALATPPEIYRMALPQVDAHARARFGDGFTALSEEQQDLVLIDLEEGEAPAFTDLDSRDFFVLIRQHTIEGMFSDPMYGGNRDMVGWELIGWPGAQRAYSAEEMVTTIRPRPPQPMAHLPGGVHGQAGDRHGATERPRGRGPVLPRSGGAGSTTTAAERPGGGGQ